MADGAPDCEAEDRETPNKQGYKALIRDHEAIRRCKSPSPPKGSDRSSRIDIDRRHLLAILLHYLCKLQLSSLCLTLLELNIVFTFAL